MKIEWSDNGIKSFQEASDYIATNFYPGYADAFENDVLETVDKLLDNPSLGKEAFKALNRPDLRKIQCHSKNWWVFYRLIGDTIEVSQIAYSKRIDINPFGPL